MSVSEGRLPGGLSPGAIVNPKRSLMIISQQSTLYREWSDKYYRLFQRADRCCIFVEAAPVRSLHRTHERLKRIVNVSGSANDRKRWLNTMLSKFVDIQGDVFEKIFYQVCSGVTFRNPLDLSDSCSPGLVDEALGDAIINMLHKSDKGSRTLPFKRKSETRQACQKTDLGVPSEV